MPIGRTGIVFRKLHQRAPLVDRSLQRLRVDREGSIGRGGRLGVMLPFELRASERRKDDHALWKLPGSLARLAGQSARLRRFNSRVEL